MGGVVSWVVFGVIVVGLCEVGFDLSFVVVWDKGDGYYEWVCDGWDVLCWHSIGVYVNFISDEGCAGVEVVYGDCFVCLMVLKDWMDVDNVFWMNVNIVFSGVCVVMVVEVVW